MKSMRRDQEPAPRFELGTARLRIECSTTELSRRSFNRETTCNGVQRVSGGHCEESLEPSTEGVNPMDNSFLRSMCNRRPLYSKQTATGHSLYSSNAHQGGRLSPEAAPNQPPNVQRRATMAELYANVCRWFREAIEAGFDGPGRQAFEIERRLGRELTDYEIDALIARAAMRRARPHLVVIRGGAR
jgi:hypothetical protein